ncbi:MAG: tetratricopeptide repeat protein [Defluviitaleaceae bacterium]|nr:tetratricopeptide repeat protein [Defluviitaleaceae bacterium]
MRFRDILKSKAPDLYSRFNTIVDDGEKSFLRTLGKNDYIHSKSVEKILDKLVPDSVKTNPVFFDSGEIFLLLVAIYLHDIGRSFESSESSHELESGNEIRKNYTKYNLDEFQGEAIAQICEAHADEDIYSIQSCNNNYGIGSISASGRAFDLQKLGALLRLADELDNAHPRVAGIGAQENSIRNRVRDVIPKFEIGIIEIQSVPRNKDEFDRLKQLTSYTQKRLDEILQYIKKAGINYYKIKLDPETYHGDVTLSHEDQNENDYQNIVIRPTSAPNNSPDIPHYLTAQAPPINDEFSYRDDMVEELNKAIKQNKKLALISGLGGIGKTTIAKALYHQIKDEYKHVAWVEYQHSIKDSLLSSFILFDGVEITERYRSIEKFLLEATRDTIIFIDNVSGNDYEGVSFIERLDINVVLTSRASNIGYFTEFPVDFLSEEQCINIFYKYYKLDKARAQEEAIRKLVKLVKCHTLSVELLARAASKPGYSLEMLAADLEEKGFEYPIGLRSIRTHHTAVSKTIAGHLKTLFELVSVNDEEKRILINFSAMPSVEIPGEVETWLGCTTDDIVGLTELGWLTTSDIGYEMHPIIKEAIRLQYKNVEYKDFESIIRYMSSDKYINATDIYTKVRARLNIAESIASYFEDVEKEEIALLFNNIAIVCSSQGDYPKALEWNQKDLKICEKVLGLEHPNTATTYNNIAAVYDKQGDYPKALEWNQKALKIREKVLGLKHPDTAATYNNIAGVYKSQGDYPKALERYQKALKIFEKVLGLEHPNTATTYNNIAAVYDDQGDYPKALEWYRKALKIREKVLGLEHPTAATTYNNIAVVYDNQGDYPKALEWHQKALKIKEKVLGLEHPSTATTYNNIAVVYDSQGDYPKALEWYQKALKTREKVLGLEHPDTATTTDSIARIKTLLN